MLTDIEIAESVTLKPIKEIAAKIGLKEKDLELYGNYKAKVVKGGSMRGKLILVTAINPTPAGEGKTTVAIGLADGISAVGKNVCLALREPSLGPVFGIKGGAAGGGRAQIAPMADINLHFNGDMHAITSANNLLSALIDNHIFQGNEIGLDKVVWRRCMDMNDRALRNVRVGIGYNERDDHFDITAASEIMAVLCLASDAGDLKQRLGDIIVGYTKGGVPVTARDMKANEAMAILLKSAIRPNLVQTLEGTPAFVHGGPFANIAHGCNSIIATKTALSCAEYVVTEAGFGADLGAEKFIDIKCRVSGLTPSCVVVVATVRALKYSGGAQLDKISEVDMLSLAGGVENLKKHIENIKGVFGLPCVVALNKFSTDTDREINYIKEVCDAAGADFEIADVWANGGEGATALAEKVVETANTFAGGLDYAYPLKASAEEKIENIAKRIYGADGVDYEPEAKAELKRLKKLFDIDSLPVCIAKTQYSLSDDAAKLGRPENFRITVREVQYRAGAGFLVAVTGKIMLMPGLPKTPNAVGMCVDGKGKISGLF